MATVKIRKCKADFFYLTDRRNQPNQSLQNLMSDALQASLTYTQAHKLDIKEPEDYQVRDIVSLNGGKVYQGVFGRCRFETLTQGTTTGDEDDVNLKPNHGLVEKNFFLYYPGQNLVVYQRNSNGSHHSKLQKYLELASDNTDTLLEPILTKDSYAKLLSNAVRAKKIDISFTRPRDPKLYSHAWTKDAISLISRAGGLSARVTISVGRSPTKLFSQMKDAVVTLAKDGLATVAKVTIEGEKEPIDLIADRIIETLDVDVDKNNRMIPRSVYQQLERAKTRREEDLQAFFGGN